MDCSRAFCWFHSSRKSPKRAKYFLTRAACIISASIVPQLLLTRPHSLCTLMSKAFSKADGIIACQLWITSRANLSQRGKGRLSICCKYTSKGSAKVGKRFAALQRRFSFTCDTRVSHIVCPLVAKKVQDSFNYFS